METLKVLCLGHRFSSLEIEKEVLGNAVEIIDGNIIEPKDLDGVISESQAVLLGTKENLGPAEIMKMNKCRIIVRYGVGLDNVDVKMANKQGILVANVPDYCVEEVSDHTLAMILAINRRLIAANQAALKGKWGTEVMGGTKRLANQTLGLIGFGRIGQSVFRKAKNLVRDTKVYDPLIDDDQIRAIGADPLEIFELVRSSDYVSIHTPLVPKTRNLFGPKLLSNMKSDAWLINTSRGEIVDEDALLKVLRNKSIGGAALDVLSSEPPNSSSPLLGLENVLITPHVAFYSRNAIEDLQRIAAEQVHMLFSGKQPSWLTEGSAKIFTQTVKAKKN